MAEAPTLAELARTVLATARVATLTAGRCPVTRTATLTTVEALPDGRPLVRLCAGSPVVALLASSPVATISVAAPTPFRTLALSGRLLPHRRRPGDAPYAMTLLAARLTGTRSRSIAVDDFRAAAPDPLHHCAQAILAHLETAHAGELLGCLRAHGQTDAIAVVPRVLDRYGLVVAILTADGVRLSRLRFPGGPVSDLTGVTLGLRAALSCRCHDHD